MTKFIIMVRMNLVTPKTVAEHELLLKKLASVSKNIFWPCLIPYRLFARVPVTYSHFHPSLIFSGKSVALLVKVRLGQK